MNSKIGQKKKERGFISVEAGLVLLVLLFLAAIAVNYYIDNLRKTSVSSNTNELISIAATAKKKYGQINEYANVTTAIAVTGQVIPNHLRDGAAATATNSFGGAITVAPATLTGANDALNITWLNVPRNQCSDIVMGLGTSARRIQVAGVDVKATDAPTNLGTTEAQCDSADVVALNVFVGR